MDRHRDLTSPSAPASAPPLATSRSRFITIAIEMD
jgi:hypothetical protein